MGDRTTIKNDDSPDGYPRIAIGGSGLDYWLQFQPCPGERSRMIRVRHPIEGGGEQTEAWNAINNLVRDDK